MSDAERARLRRANMSSSQRERTRLKNAERQRLRRTQRKAEEVEGDRERNRLSHQAQRSLRTQVTREHECEQQVSRLSLQTEADCAALRERDTEARALRRSQQTKDERTEEREANAVVQATRRSQQTDDERHVERDADRERHTNAREQQSDESRDAQRERDRERREIRRALQTEGEREEERERVREPRRTTRHRDVLANHEDFRPSMVTGPNVDEENRRHRPSPTTVCAHCNAWKWPGESKVGCCLEGKVRLSSLAPAPAKLPQLYGDPEFRKHEQALPPSDWEEGHPAVFAPGSPRQMYQSYQDSMAIVREYGKPDIFDTMTCNPTWEEIKEKITDPNQTAQDRPDIVARVWQQKLVAHLKDLDESVLGRVAARIYVVEFQKRGLQHAHILVILADEDKPPHATDH
ncbi:hypothetical protein PPTG_11128 [Phytophthora nicotianae INRA-310]|uniref:Helitron helicase-like domain-containing protein n=1 Tax=Phytophthora nicotianae (strain INRA-310) TaxID=761204 RepID=W2Q950_PHYN3|nr:hypothetical protein PPTG_11128 [Phytophthora nicotianae INRA-310]ETN09079.1 hypothetical protein PPTG_11128 [Phytophthora nicotianae INRA-310]